MTEDSLRAQVDELTDLARLLFEAPFELHDGRMPGDPTWEDLLDGEVVGEDQEMWLEAARNAQHVYGPVVEKLTAERDAVREELTRVYNSRGVFFLSMDCDCGEEILYGPNLTTASCHGAPVIPFDFAAQTVFRCDKCSRERPFLRRGGRR